MRCQNLIATRMDTKRKTPVEIVAGVLSWFHEKQGSELVTKTPGKVERCGGLVTVSLGIETSGGCGCCGGSSIEVAYSCSRCKGTFYPELPQAVEEVSDLLCALLTKMSPEDHEALKATCLKNEEDRIKRSNEMLASMRRKGAGS